MPGFERNTGPIAEAKMGKNIKQEMEPGFM